MERRGFGKRRAITRARSRECSPALVRDVLMIFEQYEPRVSNPGAYLGELLDDAIERERAVIAQQKADRLKEREDVCGRIDRDLDSMPDAVLAEAVFRCQALPRGTANAARDVRAFPVLRRWTVKWLVQHPEFLQEQASHD